MISEPRPEHPHRCTAGHRWQHTGPAALQCVIAAYDSVTGDLPFVSASECPVCCGRQDLLVRELHPHYCNLCDGDWDHEGVCVDSLAAYCPWCFPKTDAEPVPGARRGPHFHYCSECGHNWQHDAACAAPLRVALPECTACRAATAEITEAPPPEPELVLSLPVRRPRAVGGRVSRLARPIGIAAAVLLSLPILYTGYVSLMRPAVDGGRPVTKTAPTPASIASPPAAPAPSAPSRVVPAPPTAAPAVAAIKPEPEPRAAKAAPARPTATVPRVEERRIAPRDSPGEQRAARAAEQRVAEARAAQQRAADARAAEQRAAEVRVAEQRAADARVAQQRAAAARPAEQRTPDAPPRSDAPPVAARPSAPDAGRTDDTRPNVVTPAPPKRSEVAAQTAPPAQAAPPAADASAVRPTPMVVNLPSIPGAPPFGGLNGGSGRDPSLDGHPRRVLR